MEGLASQRDGLAFAHEAVLAQFQTERAELIHRVGGLGSHSVRKIAEKNQSCQRTLMAHSRVNEANGANFLGCVLLYSLWRPKEMTCSAESQHSCMGSFATWRSSRPFFMPWDSLAILGFRRRWIPGRTRRFSKLC